MVVRGFINLGEGFERASNLDRALETYQNMKIWADSMRLPMVAIDALILSASALKSNRQYASATSFEAEAIRMLENMGDTLRLGTQLVNAANTHLQLREFEMTLLLLSRADELFQHELIRPFIDGTRALVFGRLGNKDTAKHFLDRAVREWTSIGDDFAISDTKILFGGICLENGSPREAITYAQQGYDIARTHNFKAQIQNGAKVLADAYREIDAYPRALRFQAEYYLYRDSLASEATIRRMAEERAEYEVGLKQAEIDLLSASKKNQQVLAWALGIILFLTAIVAILLYRNYREKTLINEILSQQKEQLEELNDAKDKFFSIISHDLRGPVIAFHGVSRLIRHFTDQNARESLHKLAEEMDQSTDRLVSLLNGLLEWAMQQQGRFPHSPEEVNINDMMEKLTGDFKNMALGKQISLINSLQGEIRLFADPKSIETIFRNLINNALKFTPEGGTVTITGILENNHVDLTISDNGIGIPNEKLDRLFEFDDHIRSFGTSGEKGLGLGLQLVHEFVHVNHGSIQVESKEGKGTRFTLTFPRHTAPVPDSVI